MSFISDIKYLLVLLSSILLTACSTGAFDIIGTPKSSDYLRNKNDSIVSDCQERAIFKNSAHARIFWSDNNLPKGTTEFSCVDGKAYLKGEEPK